VFSVYPSVSLSVSLPALIRIDGAAGCIWHLRYRPDKVGDFGQPARSPAQARWHSAEEHPRRYLWCTRVSRDNVSETRSAAAQRWDDRRGLLLRNDRARRGLVLQRDRSGRPSPSPSPHAGGGPADKTRYLGRRPPGPFLCPSGAAMDATLRPVTRAISPLPGTSLFARIVPAPALFQPPQ